MIYSTGKPASTCISVILILFATSVFEGALAGMAASSQEHVLGENLLKVFNYPIDRPRGIYNGTIINPMSIFEFNFPRRHGYGTFVYSDQNASYTGEYRFNVRHGYGKLATDCGDGTLCKYEGYFYRGLFDGHGTYTNGKILYQGEFKAGKRHGKGYSEQLIRGALLCYAGDFQRDRRHGQGIEKFKNNCTVTRKGKFVEGILVDGYEDEYYTQPNLRIVHTGMKLHGKYHGKGCVKYRNGTIIRDGVFENGSFKDGFYASRRFIGQVLNYTFHFGKYVYPLLGTYVGGFKDRKMHGRGTLTRHSGRIAFNGTYQNGKFMTGTVNTSNCRGEFRNFKIWKGYCVEDFKLYGTYKGMFNNGKRNGNGVFSTYDGTIYSGIWEYGLPSNVTRRLPDGRCKHYNVHTPLLRSDVPFHTLTHGKPRKRPPNREKASVGQSSTKRTKKDAIRKKRKIGNQVGPAKQSRVDDDQRAT